MAIANIQALFISHQAEKTNDIIIIIQWLADSHHDNIGNTFSKVCLCGNDLADQFSRCQIAHATADGGCAKFAPHAATDLAGNADCNAMFIAHDNAFHTVSVCQRKKIFHRSVNGGNQLAANGGQMIFGCFNDALASCLGKIGHVFGRDAAVKLWKYLRCAIFWLSQGYDIVAELIGIHAEQLGAGL